MKIYKRILLIAFFLILLAVNSSFAKTGTVIVDAARLREQTNTESKIIDIVYEDDIVEILEEKDDWYKIKYNNSVGYSKKSFFKVNEEQDSKPVTNTANTTSNAKNNTVTNTQKNTVSANNTSASNIVANNTVANVASNTTNSVGNNTNTMSNNTTANNEVLPETSSQNTTQINTKVTVNSNVAMRSLPNFISNTIEQITPGKEMTKVAEINNWSQVTDGASTGWIPNAKIVVQENHNSTTELPETKPETDNTLEVKPENEQSTSSNENKESSVNKTGTINVETANVRKSATQNSDIVNTLDYGDVITITDEEGDWYKITKGDISGYVKKSLLTNVKDKNISSRGLAEERDNSTIDKDTNSSISQALSLETSVSVNGEDVAEYAKQYIGTKYVVGGKTPQAGFDCSGFTRYVFLNYGFNLGNTAANQDNIGEDVSKENLQAGDLMLFYDEDKNKIGHTGIYISNGEFVHAANPERGVVTDNLNTNTYYNERFIIGKRIVK